MSRLRRLLLNVAGLDKASVDVFAKSPHMSQLRSFSLNPVNDDLVRQIAEAQ